jgi:stage III sporulation protein AB
MLEQLQGLLENDASPMPELFRKLSKRCEGESGVFVDAMNNAMPELGKRSFQELWQCALSQTSSLAGAEKQELRMLGSLLGRYDLDSQLKALSDCREVLHKSMEKMENDQMRKPYMTVGLSLTASLLLGILLI